MIQLLTGVLLAFYYVPSVDHAYTTVSYIEKVVSSGSWLRSLHHYGSQWLSVFVFLHVIQLFLNNTYVLNKTQWISSVLILGLIMAAGGTGYSLPWDARAFFSTRVAEGLMAGLPFAGRNARFWLLGGSDISTLTLSRFFALHVLLIPAFLIAVVVWGMFRSRSITTFFNWRNAVAAGLVFLALGLWSWKHPAPLGPSVAEMSAEYLPRPGAQFLWLYQSLKYVPGGLGSLAGLVLPGIALLLLISLPWLKAQRVVGGVVLAAGVVLVATMTTAAYLSDRRDERTRTQLARQAAAEEAARREPFKPALIGVAPLPTSEAHAPDIYRRWCAQCHGESGEGGRQGPFRFPPLINVSDKPRRTVDDIVALLKDPLTYGLQRPMTSFSGKLTEEQMREIAEWVVKLKK